MGGPDRRDYVPGAARESIDRWWRSIRAQDCGASYRGGLPAVVDPFYRAPINRDGRSGPVHRHGVMTACFQTETLALTPALPRGEGELIAVRRDVFNFGRTVVEHPLL